MGWRKTRLLQTALHGLEIRRAGDHVDGAIAFDHVGGTRLEGGFEQGISIETLAIELEQPLLLEEITDAAAGSEVAPEFREHVADVTYGAILVVGQGLHQDGRPAGAVAFVDRLLVGLASAGARSLLDRPFDVVLGHVGDAGSVDGESEARIGVPVRSAHPGRRGDLPDQLGEDLSPLGVGHALLALDSGPLGMAGHGQPLEIAGDIALSSAPSQPRNEPRCAAYRGDAAGAPKRLRRQRNRPIRQERRDAVRTPSRIRVLACASRRGRGRERIRGL